MPSNVFDKEFLGAIKPLEFAENRLQYRKFRRLSADQFKLIADQPLVTI